MSFGSWLGEQRRKADLTMRELAQKSGLSAPYIATLEQDSSEPPPLRTCKALGRALGIGWEELWQLSFAARLKKWLSRQGYSQIPTEVLREVVKRIEETNVRNR